MTAFMAPYAQDGSLLRTPTPEAEWRDAVPFHATLVVWDYAKKRYITLRDLSTGATYPVGWHYWRLTQGAPVGGAGTMWRPYLIHTRASPWGLPPAWTLAAFVPNPPAPPGWPARVHASVPMRIWGWRWTGWWVVRRWGRTYSVDYRGATL